MKTFILKVAVFIVIVATITLSVNSIYVKKIFIGNEEVEKFEIVPKNIQICNFGSSHGVHGFYYEDLEEKYTCFNFALDSQSLSYDERVLNVYQNNLCPGGVVVIDISFFSCWGYPETTRQEFESKNKRYYYFLPKNMIKNYDWYTDIMTEKMPALSAGPLSVIGTILSVENNRSPNIKSYPEVDAVVDVSRLEEDTTASSQRHIFQGKRDEKGKLFFNEEEIRALYEMVDICRRHDVTPLFVTVPYLKEYTDQIGRDDPTFFDQFYNWIYDVSEKLGVEYFDYSLDERFIYDYSLFYNGDHMNSKGARKFTNILYDEVISERVR